MISLIRIVLQNRATTGDGDGIFLPEPGSLTIRVRGDGAITSGTVTLEWAKAEKVMQAAKTGPPFAAFTVTGVWQELKTIHAPPDSETTYHTKGVRGDVYPRAVRARISQAISGGTVTVIAETRQIGCNRAQLVINVVAFHLAALSLHPMAVT
jgi:hypothetical protein